MHDGSASRRIDISFGEQSIVLRRSGNSHPVVANVLGTETNPETGAATVWLDRKVHRPGETTYHEKDVAWQCGGAISTVLTRHQQQ